MKITRTLIVAITLVLSAHFAFSQDIQGLNPLPSTKDEFIKSEPSIISVIDWLETTAVGKEKDKRTQLNAILIAWITNSPTVTIEIDSKITPMSKKNPDLLVVFTGGWTKYALQNGYSKDPVKCNLAGIKSVINTYRLGDGVKKDKDIDKLVELDSKNELEAWIISQLGKK